jgi:hypothetical protein
MRHKRSENGGCCNRKIHDNHHADLRRCACHPHASCVLVTITVHLDLDRGTTCKDKLKPSYRAHRACCVVANSQLCKIFCAEVTTTPVLPTHESSTTSETPRRHTFPLFVSRSRRTRHISTTTYGCARLPPQPGAVSFCSRLFPEPTTHCTATKRGQDSGPKSSALSNTRRHQPP